MNDIEDNSGGGPSRDESPLNDLERESSASRARIAELEDKVRRLEELNTALKVLLRHRDEDKKELEETVLSNIRSLINPYIEKLRQSGLLRKIKKFASALIEDTPLREQDRPDNDITLAEWVRECRRAGLYEQGRAIYEKGGINSDNLDELRQLELLEDYGICVKRQVQSNKLKRKKTKGDEI